MATFVHFTDEKNKHAIMKNGIKNSTIHYEAINKGVFCMPVISDFYATHQWVRELKQYNSCNEIIAIYFKIPDNEVIFCGKYNEKIEERDVVKAHNIFMNLEDKMGFQVIVGRKIASNEIVKIKNIPQIIGWRHFPKSHERKRCLCPACLWKGSYNSKKTIRQESKKLFNELNNAEKLDDMLRIFDKIDELNFKKDEIDEKTEKILLKLYEINNPALDDSITDYISAFYGRRYKELYFQNIYDGRSVEISIRALLEIYGDEILREIELEKCTNETVEIVNKFKDDI